MVTDHGKIVDSMQRKSVENVIVYLDEVQWFVTRWKLMFVRYLVLRPYFQSSEVDSSSGGGWLCLGS